MPALTLCHPSSRNVRYFFSPGRFFDLFGGCMIVDILSKVIIHLDILKDGDSAMIACEMAIFATFTGVKRHPIVFARV